MKPATRPSRRPGYRRRSARPAVLVLAVVFALLVSGINPAGGLRHLFQPDVAEAAVPASPTDETKVPHYFSPYPNWANSPQTLADAIVTISVGTPTPVSFGNPLIERRYATDYAPAIGSLTPTVVPTPFSLATSILPPLSSIFRRAIGSPNPVPVALVEK